MSSLKSDPVGGGGEYGHLKLNTQGNFRELYKVGSILGEGAFGTVRLVTSRADGSKWAVKVIEKSTVTPGDHALRTEIDILCRAFYGFCRCVFAEGARPDIDEALDELKTLVDLQHRS